MHYITYARNIVTAKSCRGAESESKSYQCCGTVTQLSETSIEVTELPVRKWTQDYKEWLETLIKPEDKNEAPLLVDYKEAHTDQRVGLGLRSGVDVQPSNVLLCFMNPHLLSGALHH